MPTEAVTEPQDIQKLLASARKQIEERTKQTQALLAQQGLVSQPQMQTPSVLAQQGWGGQPQLQMQGFPQPPLLQTPRQHSTSVHPLAYSREKHLARGLGLNPSALDKAIKAAEVLL